jgi:hypothetical protein
LILTSAPNTHCTRAANTKAKTGRAIAQAVSRWFPTAAARVRARLGSSGLYGGQSGSGAGFLRVFRFTLPIFIPPNSPSSQLPGAGIIGQKWQMCEWTQFGLHPLPPYDD